MIYLHCGWPKTGTTSLQASLIRNPELLASVGVVYPESWRREVDGSHNDLENNIGVPGGADSVKRALEAYSDGDVLLSCEVLTSCLLVEDGRYRDKYEGLLELLDAMREVAPVKCIWTVRRFDRTIQSFCLQAIIRRRRREAMIEWLMETIDIDRLFPRMVEVEKRVAGNAAYIKYDSAGGHYPELLREFNLPAGVAHAIEAEVSGQPRLNAGRTHKKVIAAVNVDTVSARLDARLQQNVLLRLIKDGAFQFDDDGDCELLGPEMSQGLHERMLESARSCGFEPYVRFFGRERADRGSPAVPMDLGVLTDDDWEKLLTHLQLPV